MKLALLLLSALVAGCAKPEYVNAPGPSVGQESKDSVGVNCDLKFPLSQICVSWKWVSLPTEQTAGTMLVKLWRPNAADRSPVPVDAPGLGLYLNMDMPHPPRLAVVTQKDTGTYLLSGLFFSMHGKWYLNFELFNSAGRLNEKLQSVYYF